MSHRFGALISLLCTAALAGGFADLATASSSDDGLRIRRDVTELTARDRATYVEAVKRLKVTPSPHDPSLSWYDQFVSWHVEMSICDRADPLWADRQTTHGGPVFLPWHRQFLLMFEDALNAVMGRDDIAVPYWDWTDPASEAVVFDDSFMGPQSGDPDEDYALTSGPFRKGEWVLNVKPKGAFFGLSATDYITRRKMDGFALPQSAAVDAALALPAYDTAPWDTASQDSFRNALEGNPDEPPTPKGASPCLPDGTGTPIPLSTQDLHNHIHNYVGGFRNEGGVSVIFGTMAEIMASPNDPIFFLHHAQVDRVWAQWQERHGIDTYEPRSGVPHNNIDSPLEPFGAAGIRVTPGDLLDTEALGYRYDGVNPDARLCVLRPEGRRPPAR